MARGVATREAPKKPSENQRSKQELATIEVEINGQKVQAQTQTVPTGAGSITRLVSSLLHRA